MKITVLEYGDSGRSHLITKIKAQWLVEELQVAVYVAAHVIQITAAHSWSVIKTWLKLSQSEHRDSLRKLQSQQEHREQMSAQCLHPQGAQFGFSRWPSPDMRSM